MFGDTNACGTAKSIESLHEESFNITFTIQKLFLVVLFERVQIAVLKEAAQLFVVCKLKPTAAGTLIYHHLTLIALIISPLPFASIYLFLYSQKLDVISSESW